MYESLHERLPCLIDLITTYRVVNQAAYRAPSVSGRVGSALGRAVCR